jgi:hypothetical protein
MTTHTALVTIGMIDQNPKNTVVNTWHIHAPSATTTDFDSFRAAITAFYDSWSGSMSAGVDKAAFRMRIYKMTDPKPRIPVYDVILNVLTLKGSNFAPSELALVMSFQGIRASGASQARRRNRVYLGPLAVSAIDSSTGRPLTGFLTNVRSGGAGLLAASTAASGWKWSINSSFLPLDGSQFVNVANGWVDNAFDIQRRRGIDATSRSTF